jgi:hypothetical protein
MQTRPSRPHQNKRNDPLLRIVLIWWQNVLNIINNVLMQISVPAEDESQQSAASTHALRGSSTFISTHAPSRPALSYPLQALEAKHKQPNLKQQRSIHNPNISTKATYNQNNLHKQEKKANTPKSQHTFVEAVP